MNFTKIIYKMQFFNKYFSEDFYDENFEILFL